MNAPTLLKRIASLGLILMMGVNMSACFGTDEGVSQCPVDTIPIQIVGESGSDSVITLSADRLPSDPQFRAFVTAVTKHVVARLDRDKLCIDSADSKKRSLLQFVNWSIANWGNMRTFPMSLPDARPAGVCRITSPWIDLAIERKPVPSIRGVVRWNQRQLLADQALLAGARNVPSGVAMPLKQKDFLSFARAYADSELLGKSAAKPIEERVPTDLLWLFRHSWQTTFAPFEGEAIGSMHVAMKKGAEHYTKLVIALIDRCFDAGGAEIQYNSILDAADLVSLEQYKINTLTR